jgi:hypothetical protein
MQKVCWVNFHLSILSSHFIIAIASDDSQKDVPWIDDGADTRVPHAFTGQIKHCNRSRSTLLSNHTLVTAIVVWMTMGNWQSLGDGSQVSRPRERERMRLTDRGKASREVLCSHENQTKSGYRREVFEN